MKIDFPILSACQFKPIEDGLHSVREMSWVVVLVAMRRAGVNEKPIWPSLARRCSKPTITYGKLARQIADNWYLLNAIVMHHAFRIIVARCSGHLRHIILGETAHGWSRRSVGSARGPEYLHIYIEP